jgi:hypothetical protein
VIASMIRLMNAGTVDAFRADLLGRILVTGRLIVKRRTRA